MELGSRPEGEIEQACAKPEAAVDTAATWGPASRGEY